MIFHQDNLILFHPGKTAGTSIEQMLLPGHNLDPYTTNRDLMYGYDRKLGIFLQHANCQTTKTLVPEDVFSRYYKICVVRNPFSRLLSAFLYDRESYQKTFGSFRNYILSLPQQVGEPVARKGVHVSPQVDYTHIDGIICVDRIFKFEELSAMESALSRRLGRKLELPRLNIGRYHHMSGEDQAPRYDDETREIITRIYANDFKLFGYSENQH